MSEPFTFSTVQPHLDSRLSYAMIVSCLTGLYCAVFAHAIVPTVRKRRKLLSFVLTLLFCLNVINLAAVWDHARYVFVLNDSSRESMYIAFMDFRIPGEIEDFAMVLCVLLADFILVWRCCMLWLRSRWMIGAYALVFLAHIVLIPLYMLQSVFDVHIGPRISFFCIYLLISVGVTLSATSLIIYRIKRLSSAGRYSYVVDALIQSGAIYSLANLVISALLAAREINPFNTGLIEVTTYVGSLLTPTAGITTTWISGYLIAHQERDKITLTGTLTTLRFQSRMGIQPSSFHTSAASPIAFASGPSHESVDSEPSTHHQLSEKPTEQVLGTSV